ncbi:MAG: outer membrane protein assembly factor BamD [Candidatus Acidiferrales bacterium]
MRTSPILLLAGLALALTPGCHRHKHADLDLADSAEPDKILYERSLEDIENKRFDVARLTLQTLLNTYPDSEYLPDAKLGIADSYYQEGVSGALTSAEVEYKDFITFFPNHPKVSFAQYRAAMANYRRLEKPDRDRTYARRAERELQLLLLNYPDSEYAAEGERKLIAVQEILAEGEFRVANFYYKRETWRAAAQRLVDLVDRYPNHSKRDQSLWMLGQAYEKEIPGFWEAKPKEAAAAYTRLAREHPASEYAEKARAELARLGASVPEPDPVLLARAQSILPVKEEMEDRPGQGLLGRLFGVFSGRPDISEAAARLGPPPLEQQELRKLPPPPFAMRGQVGGGGSSVTVQTVEDLPSGTVVKSGEEGEAPPQAKGEEKPAEGEQAKPAPPPPPKKKSFWRKIIPW